MQRRQECDFNTAYNCANFRYPRLAGQLARYTTILEFSRKHAPGTVQNAPDPSPAEIEITKLTASTVRDLTDLAVSRHMICAMCILNSLLDSIPEILDPKQ